MLQNILLVEDGEQNIKDAQDALGNISVARSFAEFEDEFLRGRPDSVLSDLYFPTGYHDERHERLKADSAAILEDYISQCQKHNPVGLALEKIFEVIGVTTIDEYFKIFGDDAVIQIESYREKIRRSYDDYEKVKDYKKLVKDIKEGFHELPSGIFVYRRCKEEGIPAVIVTSAYHHGTEFQPFVNHVGAYFDNLVDGKKQWENALKYITRGEK